MFLAKKVIASFLFPLPFGLLLIFLGLFLLWFTRRQVGGKFLTTLGALLIALLAYQPISDRLLAPMERTYPPVMNAAEYAGVRWVVVLGGGHVSEPHLPVTSRLAEGSVVRLAEGIRLLRQIPDGRLLLSGGGAFDPVPHAEVLAECAAALGVSPDVIRLQTRSKDTKDEAREILKMIGKEPFFLVTSASHMPRAVALFKKLGMRPIPAPTGHLAKRPLEGNPQRYFPSPEGLYKSRRLVYETLGMLWARLRGQI